MVYMVYLIAKIHNWTINAIIMASPQHLGHINWLSQLRVAWSHFEWLRHELCHKPAEPSSVITSCEYHNCSQTHLRQR